MEYELQRHPYCIALTWAKEPELLGNAKGTCQTAWKVEGIRHAIIFNLYVIMIKNM